MTISKLPVIYYISLLQISWLPHRPLHDQGRGSFRQHVVSRGHREEFQHPLLVHLHQRPVHHRCHDPFHCAGNTGEFDDPVVDDVGDGAALAQRGFKAAGRPLRGVVQLDCQKEARVGLRADIQSVVGLQFCQ